jgi:hypothetical protein
MIEWYFAIASLEEFIDIELCSPKPIGNQRQELRHI